MNRRNFSKKMIIAGTVAGMNSNSLLFSNKEETFNEDTRKLPSREFDVIVAGGGTAGTVAAVAAARNGAKTALIESKGYLGGTVVEGGTALHSYFNLWTAFPG
ncbi:MAG TPA: FAD-dependent oxidoreductase, partial [Bacteroidales bacterium]|nr:FAD-dependent oxidoreductase [Bacteroidales bacterium]